MIRLILAVLLGVLALWVAFALVRDVINGSTLGLGPRALGFILLGGLSIHLFRSGRKPKASR